MSVKYLTNTLWFHNIFSSFNSRSYCTYYTFGSRVFNKKVKIQKLFIRIKLLGAKKKKLRYIFWPFSPEKKGFSLNSDLQRGVFYFIIYSKLLRTWLTWMSKFVSQLHDTLQNYCNYALNGILFPKLFWPIMRKKISRDLNFENSRLKAEKLKKIWVQENNILGQWRSVQFLKQIFFLTCSKRFLRSDTSE